MVILSTCIYNLIGIKSESRVPILSRTQEHLTPTSHILGLDTSSTTTNYAIIDNVSVQYSNLTSFEQLKNGISCAKFPGNRKMKVV